MAKNKRSKSFTYYAVYKYCEYESIVYTEVPSGVFCPCFTANTFQEAYERVDRFFRSLAIMIKNDTSFNAPESVKFKEIQSKFKATDGYKFSKLVINPKTCELTHTKLSDFELTYSSESFHINDMKNQDVKIIPFSLIKE